jgi:predicted phage-related endonuclease
MPDPTRQTISATQASALWNVSPYTTRWMLWKHFAHGMAIDDVENARMSWGKKLQPLIIEQAAEDLKLEVRPNADDSYHRRGLIGCTRDATIICPDRGPGALETKCVFDYRTWMADWNGGKNPPRCHEVQLQTQMAVGEEDGEPYAWGIIAAWVAGDVHYFERGEAEGFRQKLNADAAAFFDDVRAAREPNPFGVPLELPWLSAMFPVQLGETIDLDDRALAEAAIQYRDAKEQESGGARAAEHLRAKLLAAAKTAEHIILPDGVRVRIRPHGKGKRINVYVPGDTPADLMMAG